MGRPDYYSFSVGHFNSYQKLDNLSASHVSLWSCFEGVVACLVQCGIKYQRCCLSVGVSHCRGTKLLFFFLWLCKYRCGQIELRQHLDEHCCPQPSDSTRRARPRLLCYRDTGYPALNIGNQERETWQSLRKKKRSLLNLQEMILP